jgi:hypothetical protein
MLMPDTARCSSELPGDELAHLLVESTTRCVDVDYTTANESAIELQQAATSQPSTLAGWMRTRSIFGRV